MHRVGFEDERSAREIGRGDEKLTGYQRTPANAPLLLSVTVILTSELVIDGPRGGEQRLKIR